MPIFHSFLTKQWFFISGIHLSLTQLTCFTPSSKESDLFINQHLTQRWSLRCKEKFAEGFWQSPSNPLVCSCTHSFLFTWDCEVPILRTSLMLPVFPTHFLVTVAGLLASHKPALRLDFGSRTPSLSLVDNGAFLMRWPRKYCPMSSNINNFICFQNLEKVS